MNRCISFLFLALVLICFTSCDPEVEPVDADALGFAYTPLEVGKYWVYKSDSIVYKLGGTVRDTLSGFIMEEVTDTFIDAANEKAYRIERFFKRDLADQWGEPRIWTASKTSTNYIRTEENLKFIRLIFPPKLNSEWEGNAFIDPTLEQNIGGESVETYKGFWDYGIDSVDIQYSYEGLVSDDAIRVVHIDSEDFIDKRYSEEQYAKNIGMVYKKMVILDISCDICPDLVTVDNATKGFILELSLIEHN